MITAKLYIDMAERHQPVVLADLVQSLSDAERLKLRTEILAIDPKYPKLVKSLYFNYQTQKWID